MSEILLPPGLVLPQPIEHIEKPDESATALQKNLAVPKPTGWKILCAVPPAKETFEGSGIVKADTVRAAEEQTTCVLFVVAVGPDAYKDTAKFPTGAWCKEGDFIMTRTYAGTRFRLFGREFRLLNDDMVDAVVEDPRGLSRA
jgi:co-chaperonin GroES (HSP10)